MHPRKSAFHLVLSRLQVPVDVRTIIVEDCFLLPKEQQSLTVEKMKSLFTDFLIDFDPFCNIIRYNCMTSNCLYIENWWQDEEGLNIKFCNSCRRDMIIYSKCKGDCLDKRIFTHTCNDYIEIDDFNSYFVLIENAEDEQSWNVVLDEILRWYHNKILIN